DAPNRSFDTRAPFFQRRIDFIEYRPKVEQATFRQAREVTKKVLARGARRTPRRGSSRNRH
ncbi:hypothetical protein, partial [Burkholderia pseudomallei]|uniref:hypothetical protein n=1 Tax=Burkholderia pseudomallei TaxID=28450 RepID=UPI001C4D41A2